jgi:hypothetical protein
MFTLLFNIYIICNIYVMLIIITTFVIVYELKEI